MPQDKYFIRAVVRDDLPKLVEYLKGTIYDWGLPELDFFLRYSEATRAETPFAESLTFGVALAPNGDIINLHCLLHIGDNMIMNRLAFVNPKYRRLGTIKDLTKIRDDGTEGINSICQAPVHSLRLIVSYYPHIGDKMQLFQGTPCRNLAVPAAVEEVKAGNLNEVLDYDFDLYPNRNYFRRRFMEMWLSFDPADCYGVLVRHPQTGKVSGYGSLRIYKHFCAVMPAYADSKAQGLELLAALLQKAKDLDRRVDLLTLASDGATFRFLSELGLKPAVRFRLCRYEVVPLPPEKILAIHQYWLF